MGCCSGRCFIVTFCIFQLVFTVERQVFDFLGFMWASILANFLHIIFVIVGLFGAYQYRPKFLVLYAVWNSLWLGWNVFIICLYLDVGVLKRESSILSLGIENRTWWFNQNLTCIFESSGRGAAEEGCVEIVHAALQAIMALIAFVAACYVIYVFTEEDDSSQTTRTNDLEFIKRRYKAPARSSFRDIRKIDTLNRSNFNSTQVLNQLSEPTANRSRSQYSASDVHSEYSRSVNNVANTTNNHSNSLRSSRKSKKKEKKHTGELPWVRVSPSPNKPTDHYGNHIDDDEDDLPDTSLSAPSEYRENQSQSPGNDQYVPDDYGPYPYTFEIRQQPAVMV